MQFKLTKKEKSWILYDVGNSAFVLMVSTILPVYFNYLAQNAGVSDVDYLAYWGYAASISTLIVAVLGPVMGTLADTRGFKKPLFLSCILVGCAGCLLMGLSVLKIEVSKEVKGELPCPRHLCRRSLKVS